MRILLGTPATEGTSISRWQEQDWVSFPKFLCTGQAISANRRKAPSQSWKFHARNKREIVLFFCEYSVSVWTRHSWMCICATFMLLRTTFVFHWFRCWAVRLREIKGWVSLQRILVQNMCTFDMPPRFVFVCSRHSSSCCVSHSGAPPVHAELLLGTLVFQRTPESLTDDKVVSFCSTDRTLLTINPILQQVPGVRRALWKMWRHLQIITSVNHTSGDKVLINRTSSSQVTHSFSSFVVTLCCNFVIKMSTHRWSSRSNKRKTRTRFRRQTIHWQEVYVAWCALWCLVFPLLSPTQLGWDTEAIYMCLIKSARIISLISHVVSCSFLRRLSNTLWLHPRKRSWVHVRRLNKLL